VTTVIVPVSLEIENFMNHRESFIDFSEFNSCLVVGKDINDYRKSNGTGKSTIYKAIRYVLFNNTDSKKIEKIVRDGADKCKVTFVISVDSDDYKIVRQRSNKSNKSDLKMFKKIGDDWKPIDAKTSTETDAILQKLIIFNYESFSNSILFEQGTFSKLAEGTDTEKRKILKEPLNLGIYSKYEKIAKDKLSVIEKEFDKTKSIIESLGDPDGDIEISKKDLLSNEQLYIVDQKKYDNIKNDLSSLRNDVSDLEKLLSSDAAQLSEKLVEIDKKKSQIAADITKCNNQILSFEGSIKAYNDKISKIKEEINQAKTELASEEAYNNINEDDVHKEIEELEAKETKGIKYVASLEVEHDRLSKPLPEGSQCNVCFNELNEEYREKISKENKLKSLEINGKLTLSKNKLSNIKEKKKNLFSDIKKISARNKSNEIISLEKTITSNESLIVTANDNIKNLNDELSSCLEKEIEYNKQTVDFNIEDTNKRIVELRSNIRNLESIEALLVSNIKNIMIKKGILQERINSRTSDKLKLEELLKNKSSLDKKVKIHYRAVKAFSSTGIPTLIIHTILDDLQVEANVVLDEIRPGLSLQFTTQKEDKDALDIIYKINGKNRDYSLLSGGQKMYFSFALKLGLSIVIQKRLGVDFRMLLLDEVDQPLDAAGQDAFVDIIKKYHSKFKICVVTHNDRLKNKMTHAILVENDGNNGATAKVVTSW
jgi:DNA repair exonuclease SbcCD ATPase subunit